MIWSLQTLRFAAASMVLFLHAVQSAMRISGVGAVPYQYALVGSAGVDIFFVISGVIMATVAPGRTAAEFIRARVLRVVPIYLLCSIPALPMMAIGPGLGWRNILTTLFLWPATDQMAAPALGVAWTLCFEMLFYAAVALVLYDRRWLYALGAIFIAAFLLRWVGPVFQFLGNPIILEFIAGVAIARIGKVRWGFGMLPLGVAALFSAAWLEVIPNGHTGLFLTGEENLQRIAVLGIPAVLIVYGAMHFRAQQSVWTYLGEASYSLYLVHPILISALAIMWVFYPVDPNVIIVVAILVSLVASWRVHERIEKPMIAWIKRRMLSAAGRANAMATVSAGGHLLGVEKPGSLANASSAAACKAGNAHDG
ncbi:acyltransferase family protein [Mesorhizobium australafricanum]|uniref:Acyltransferase n=1 Tax=Mesorhizobium australafricanum TaxID=3072311 RepID=A0ABU4WRN9_9HYPH|nr:acyltransferase [Mesorhizobium sp. VK3E]MDX8438703.1 acyltransferase [Mesorhizobium sp. VK3E]